MTRKRKTALSPGEEDNFANVAKLDGYLDGHYDQYVSYVAKRFVDSEETFGGVTGIDSFIAQVTSELKGWDAGLYRYLSGISFPVRDEAAYSRKLQEFAKVIVNDAKTLGRI